MNQYLIMPQFCKFEMELLESMISMFDNIIIECEESEKIKGEEE